MPARNAFLSALPLNDRQALQTQLRPLSLHAGQSLLEPGDAITRLYFPTTAVISLVVVLPTGQSVEAAMVGRDGAVGVSAGLGVDVSFSRAIVQLAGSALECPAEALKRRVAINPDLMPILARNEQALYAEAQQSAACLANHDVHKRVCRWLCRAQRLYQSNTLGFTQEFIAEMMGVRRSSVNPVALDLQRAGIIEYARGKITILDLEALREAACECEEILSSHRRRLLSDELNR